MEEKYKQKTLEVLSIVTEKNLTNGRFAITFKNKKTFITDTSTGKSVRISPIYNQIFKILEESEEDLSAYIIGNSITGGKLVDGGMGAIPRDIINCFKELSDFVLDENDEVYKKDMILLRNAFKVATEKYSGKESLEYQEYLKKEKEIELELEKNNITIKEFYKNFFYFNRYDFDLFDFDYFMRCKEEVELIGNLPECEHENLVTSKYPNKCNFKIVCSCLNCNLSFVFNIISKEVSATPYINKKNINISSFINTQNRLLNFLRSVYFEKFINFLDFIEYLKRKYIRELYRTNKFYKLITNSYEKSLYKKDKFGLEIKKDKNTGEIIAFIFDKCFNLEKLLVYNDYMNKVLEDSLKEIITNTSKKIEEKIKKEDNKQKIEELFAKNEGIYELLKMENIDNLIIVALSVMEHTGYSGGYYTSYGDKVYIKMLSGSNEKIITSKTLVNSPFYGTLKHLTEDEIKNLINILRKNKILRTNFVSFQDSKKIPVLGMCYGAETKIDAITEIKLRRGEFSPSI